jgi:hypothetical protein
MFLEIVRFSITGSTKRDQRSSIFQNEAMLGLNAVSGAGEPPPCALSDTDVNLSAHPAPIIQPSVFKRLCLLHRFLP